MHYRKLSISLVLCIVITFNKKSKGKLLKVGNLLNFLIRAMNTMSIERDFLKAIKFYFLFYGILNRNMLRFLK